MTVIDDGWIGVDLDCTLAFYDHWRGIDHIGKPVPRMMQRVLQWVREGREVRIFTARVSTIAEHDDRNGQTVAQTIGQIQDWCETHGLPRLGVTCVKDFKMIELWDDRAVSVVPNTGRIRG